MQLAASVGLIVIGLFVALVARAPADLHAFGWLLAGVGVLGLVIRWAMARRGDRRPR
jgi:hypothetical protein